MSLDEQMDVIGHDFQGDDFPVVLRTLRSDQRFTPGRYVAYEDGPPVLRTPDDVVAEVVGASWSVGYESSDTAEYTSVVYLIVQGRVIPLSPKGGSPLARTYMVAATHARTARREAAHRLMILTGNGRFARAANACEVTQTGVIALPRE